VDCRACQERGKTWDGGDPVCSFPDGGAFTPRGWNCATANAIRDVCGDAWERERNPAVDLRRHEDQNYATILIDNTDLPSGPALALWVSWYKDRGRTEAMWLLHEGDAPRRPTEADAIAIIEALDEAQEPASAARA
jgi:hypothetical protein